MPIEGRNNHCGIIFSAIDWLVNQNEFYAGKAR